VDLPFKLPTKVRIIEGEYELNKNVNNTNYRDYQYSIVQKALFDNTLVVLPTGLGKTFIAAVVMYNFHRWFPRGKIVFMAPTKPLVAQQIQACTCIMPLPKSDLSEMTGMIAPEKREGEWNSKRVFFVTPQVHITIINATDTLTHRSCQRSW